MFGVALLAGVLTIAVFHPAMHGDFVWDDGGLITKRHDTLDEWSDIPAAFGRAATAGEGVAYYRPIMIATFVVDAQLFGLDAPTFHRTNVILHGVNVALIVLVLVAYGCGLWPAAVAALAFGLHPLQCQAVALILGRNDVLLIPPVAAMLLADEVVRRRGRPRLADALVAIGFAATLWTKETGIVAPAFLVVLDLCWRRKPVASLRERLPLGIALAVVLALYFGARLAVIGALMDNGRYGYVALVDRPALATAILGYYVRHVLLPWGSAPAPYHPGLVDPTRPDLWIAAGFVLVYLATVVVTLRRAPRIACGLLIFGGALVPVLALAAQMKVLILDHRTYLPLLGLAFAIAGSGRVVTSMPGRALAVAILVIFATLTHRRLPSYADSLSLWSLAVDAAPSSDYAHNNLGATLMDADRFPEAVEQFREALQLNPGYDVARLNLAGCLDYLGQHAEALREFETLVERRPQDTNLMNRLAQLRMRAGDLAGARALWERAVELKPTDPGLVRNLAGVLERQQSFAAAVPLRRRMTELQPTNGANWAALARSLNGLGQSVEAAQAYERALAIGPETGGLRIEYAQTLWQIGRWNDAAIQVRRARELGVVDPQLVQRLNEAGVLDAP